MAAESNMLKGMVGMRAALYSEKEDPWVKNAKSPPPESTKEDPIKSIVLGLGFSICLYIVRGVGRNCTLSKARRWETLLYIGNGTILSPLYSVWDYFALYIVCGIILLFI